MRFLRQIRSSLWFTMRRLRSTWAITLATVATLTALIGVWVGLPLYAESASSRLLSLEVDDAASDGVPFGYLFSYNRLSGGNRTFDDFAPLNNLIDGDDSPFGPNVKTRQRLFITSPFSLIEGKTPTGTLTDESPTEIDTVSFASMSGFDERAMVVQGRFARPAASLGEPVEVMVSQSYAEMFALAAGERLTVLNRQADAGAANRLIDVVITGLWAVPEGFADTDNVNGVPDPATRFLRNSTMTTNLVVPEATLANVIDLLGDTMMSDAQWLVLLDSSSVTTDSVESLLARTGQINREVDDRLRGARLLVSPENSLQNFREDVARLNRGLRLFSLPTLALVIAVAVLLSAMRWNRRRPEVMMLRRRGVRASQIVFETAVEALVITGVSAIAGVFAARLMATLMGRTKTFLHFGNSIDLDLVMNSRSWSALVVAAVLSMAIVIVPSISAFQATILAAESSESDQRPWWQRSFLDLALVAAIAFFTWFLLRGDNLQRDLLDDPIVILVPAAGAFAAALLTLRLLPTIAAPIAKALERTRSTAALLVARRVARLRQDMTAPLLLLVITAALAVYTGSLARTLDLQLFDTAHHSVGGVSSVRSTVDEQLATRFEIVDGRSTPVGDAGSSTDPRILDQVWGVSNASRLAVLSADLEPPAGRSVPVNFMGIDTETFTETAFWRDDYASRTLPELIARLEATPDSLLVTSRVLGLSGLELGDVVTLAVRVNDRVVDTDMVIVGTFDQFPTWMPTSQVPPAVGSLTNFEARAGTTVARDLLFVADPTQADLAQTRADLRRVGITGVTPLSATDVIERIQQRPERQGVFGLLTVGFSLSAALTIAGFIFYAVFGFRRQLTELGVLRALGLPLRSLMAVVALDLLVVSAVGVGFGALAGIAMARWYLPQLVANPAGSAPRMLQEIDWGAAIGIPAALAVVLAVATLALLIILRKIRLFAAIKVGAS